MFTMLTLNSGSFFALDSFLSFAPAQLRSTHSTPFLVLTFAFYVFSFFNSTIIFLKSLMFFSSVSVSSPSWIFSLPCSSLLFFLLLRTSHLCLLIIFPWPAFLLKSSISVTGSLIPSQCTVPRRTDTLQSSGAKPFTWKYTHSRSNH